MLWLRAWTHNARVVSSNPAYIKIKTLVEKASLNHLMQSIFLEETQSPVSSFCCAWNWVWEAGFIYDMPSLVSSYLCRIYATKILFRSSRCVGSSQNEPTWKSLPHSFLSEFPFVEKTSRSGQLWQCFKDIQIFSEELHVSWTIEDSPSRQRNMWLSRWRLRWYLFFMLLATSFLGQ